MKKCDISELWQCTKRFCINTKRGTSCRESQKKSPKVKLCKLSGSIILALTQLKRVPKELPGYSTLVSSHRTTPLQIDWDGSTLDMKNGGERKTTYSCPRIKTPVSLSTHKWTYIYNYIYIDSVTWGWNAWPLIHRNMVKHMINIYIHTYEICWKEKSPVDLLLPSHKRCWRHLRVSDLPGPKSAFQKPDGECCFLIHLEQNSPFLGINL